MTLSGGEAQRIRLATQIGSRLSGVLYVLDEPSIGLHERDNQKLIATLKEMRDLGNTLIVVEHDEETMRSADYIVDIGPRCRRPWRRSRSLWHRRRRTKRPPIRWLAIISRAASSLAFRRNVERAMARNSSSKARPATTLRTLQFVSAWRIHRRNRRFRFRQILAHQRDPRESHSKEDDRRGNLSWRL